MTAVDHEMIKATCGHPARPAGQNIKPSDAIDPLRELQELGVNLGQ